MLKNTVKTAVSLFLPLFGLAICGYFLDAQDEGIQLKSATKASEYVALTKATSWKDANDVDRRSWIHLNTDGSIRGSVKTILSTRDSSTPSSDVSMFLMQGNEVIKRAKTNDEGSFDMQNVKPGRYNLVGTHVNGFIAFGLTVLANEANQSEQQLDLSLVPVNVSQLKLDDKIHFASENVVVNEEAEKASVEFNPLKVDGAVASTSINSHPVELLDGKLHGTVRNILQDGRPAVASNANVIIFQGEDEVARTKSDEFGHFEVDGLAAGSYSFVGYDNVGFAAFGFEVTETEAEALTSDQTFVSTTAVQQDGEILDVSFSEPIFFPQAEVGEIIEEIYYPVVNDRGGLFGLGFGGGGPGGSLGFGGGGIGGGGGLVRPLLRTAALGGLVYGIVELADDDDINIQQDSSPSNP